MPDRYCLPTGYEARTAADYFCDDLPEGGLLWQPDVYRDARRIARHLKSNCVIDVGAGSGDKLLKEIGTNQRIALEFGGNLDRGRQQHRDIDWRHYDAEADDGLPVSDKELSGAVIICADVIEHLPQPERLAAHLRSALERGAACCLLSTPDRERFYDGNQLGPPSNVHHVREWTRDELVAFLGREGLPVGAAGWTRSHRHSLAEHTILLILGHPSVIDRAGYASDGGLFPTLVRSTVDRLRIRVQIQALWFSDQFRRARTRLGAGR